MAAATDNTKAAERALKQKAVYWALNGYDRFGKVSYATPIEISCKWENLKEQFIDPNGDRQISNAKLIVDRDLEIKGKLKQGELDSTIENDPEDNDDVWEIMQTGKAGNRKATKFAREVYL
jgi:hypothetical protein